jgi:hypothetical protein
VDQRRPNPLEAAYAHLRGLYEAGIGDEEGGWFARLEFEETRLLDWSRENGLLGGSGELIPASAADGEEHRVMLDKSQGRVFKATHPETYGGAPSLHYGSDENGRPITELVMGKATPMQYLERWVRSNEVFSDEVRLERIFESGYGLSIMVSQRDVRGESPDLEEIAAYFQSRGFIPVPSARDAWYRPADHLLALDAHQGNLVRTADGLVPIDIPIHRPDRDVTQWLARQRFIV